MSSRIMSYNNKNEQQQQLPMNTNNAYNLPKDVLKLDLHGYTKSEGICRTTEFLDRASSRQSSNNGGGKAWVLIVTGSGSHSSQTQGRKFKIITGIVSVLFFLINDERLT
jgi:DNA-nicking Smr family endonuclease